MSEAGHIDDSFLPPEWFTTALAAPCESNYVEADGTVLHYLSWNAHDTHKPGLLLTHGFRAHARWWSFIAPFFIERYRVAALDFSGMGDSGGRTEYTDENYSRDVLAVLEHARFERPAIVGHSFGGGRVLHLCAHHPGRVERAVIVDSFVQLNDGEPKIRPSELRKKKIYSTYEAARARFRLVPAQSRAPSFILNHVAEHSIKRVDDGWSWKFDDTRPRLKIQRNLAGMLASIRTPMAYVYGDNSAVVSHELAHEIVSHIPNCRGPIAIPQSHHHVLLDQPLSLVAALRALLY